MVLDKFGRVTSDRRHVTELPVRVSSSAVTSTSAEKKIDKSCTYVFSSRREWIVFKIIQSAGNVRSLVLFLMHAKPAARVFVEFALDSTCQWRSLLTLLLCNGAKTGLARI